MKYTVFGMGDAFGQISFWEIGEKKLKETPIFLLKNDDSGMTIGNIEFEKSGKFCISSTDKKFIMVVCLDNDLEDAIGPKIPIEKYLQDNYGSARPGAKEIMKTYKDLVKQKPQTPVIHGNSNQTLEPQSQSQKDSQLPELQPEEIKKIIKHYKKGKLLDPSADSQSNVLPQGSGNSNSNVSASQKPPDITNSSIPFLSNMTVENSSKMILEQLERKPQPVNLSGLLDDDAPQPSDKKMKTHQIAGKTSTSSTMAEKDASRVFLPGLAKIGESGAVSFSRTS